MISHEVPCVLMVHAGCLRQLCRMLPFLTPYNCTQRSFSVAYSASFRAVGAQKKFCNRHGVYYSLPKQRRHVWISASSTRHTRATAKPRGARDRDQEFWQASRQQSRPDVASPSYQDSRQQDSVFGGHGLQMYATCHPGKQPSVSSDAVLLHPLQQELPAHASHALTFRFHCIEGFMPQ